MQKQIGSILLVAGTCIGSGMIALPMVLAKLGIVPSILLMLLIYVLMYFTSLISLELHLQAGKGLALGALGKLFSGKIAEIIGLISLKLLSYSLLAVFIYGGSSVLQKLIISTIDIKYEMPMLSACYAGVATFLLLLPIKLIDYINRILFIGLLGVATVLVAGLISAIDYSDLPLFGKYSMDLSIWSTVLPVVFTAFGFQGMLHTLSNYCNNNAIMLKRSCLWGTLIPAIVYIIWSCSVLSVMYHYSPNFYQQMIEGKAEVGDLIKELGNVAKWQSVQVLVWWISMLAIITSLLGVGVGLVDSIKHQLDNVISQPFMRTILAVIATILPSYLIAVLVPNAFITVLGFAGMILVIIAILLPVYLLHKAKVQNLHYHELKQKWLLILSVIAGSVIIICELVNML